MNQQSEYYLRRAEAELALAQSASNLDAVRAHYHLAGRYLDKAYGDEIEKAPRRDGRAIMSGADAGATA